MKTIFKKKSLLFFVSSLFIILFLYCSGESDSNPTAPKKEITVTITPATVELEPGDSQQFTATVNETDNTAVTWIVENNIGTITQDGLYKAPITINQESVNVIIKAISNADATKEGMASITIKLPPVDITSVVKEGYNTPQYMKSTGEEALALGAEAVWQASLINGGQVLVTTGTLTQTAVNSTEFTYSASPNDRLVVKFANNTMVDFTVKKMDGDFNTTSENFLQQPHDFQINMSVDDGTDIDISSYQNNGQRQGTLAGSIVYDNKTWQVNMALQGNYASEVNAGSASYENEEQITGTITGIDFSMTLNEYYTYKSIYVDNFVENVERRANSSWEQNNTNYALKDVIIRKAFYNGTPSELDSYWIAQGSFLENNVQIGQVTAGTEAGYLKIWMQLTDEKVLLEQYALN